MATLDSWLPSRDSNPDQRLQRPIVAPLRHDPLIVWGIVDSPRMARNVYATLKDLGMQVVAVAIFADAVRMWLCDYPVAPVGVGLGFVIGVGNGLRWWRQA